MQNSSVEKLRKLDALRKRTQNLYMEIVRVDPWQVIRIGYQEYKLEFNFKAALEIFRVTGININIDSVSPALLGDMDIFPKLMVAGLSTYHADIFPDEDSVMVSMNPRYMNYYIACLTKALSALQPDDEQLNEIMSETRNLSEDDQLPLALTDTSFASGESAGTSDAQMPTFSE